MKDYQYPIDIEWTTEEMILVMDLWAAVEEAYEKGIAKQTFLDKYRGFKTVVRSIGEERKLGKEFEAISGYSLYHVVQEAKQTTKATLKMKGK
ncbi:UPF0223 family protein [Enterococcus sp.]|uniref:UPF0223 family protein n=1 Tax=Enterococcus sp. TaxID=35783 RepID=UPI002FC9FA59